MLGKQMLSSYRLANHFRYFFGRLNPSPTFRLIAGQHYRAIKGVLENTEGPAAILRPTCFLQGSYGQETAIYTINDVDIVALCNPWPTINRFHWSRNTIFDLVAAPLLADGRYKDKVRYSEASMCIKIDLGIKVEILPAVRNPLPVPRPMAPLLNQEPFQLFRPETDQWENGYARKHRNFLSLKNSPERTGGNFIPAVKVFKHLRKHWNIGAVSFHIECLLYRLPDSLFRGAPATYIPNILKHIASFSADCWYSQYLWTPCGERDIFTDQEWKWEDWAQFHGAVETWSSLAWLASISPQRSDAISYWQLLLGDSFFPKAVAS